MQKAFAVDKFKINVKSSKQPKLKVSDAIILGKSRLTNVDDTACARACVSSTSDRPSHCT